MSSDMISEKALKKAAAQVRDAMLDEAMVLETEEHTFSPEFEESLERELPVKQRRKAVPAAVAWPVAAMLVLVVGISCWLAGISVKEPANSGSLAAENEQRVGSDAAENEDNALPVSEMYTASYRFSVDGLVGSVVLAQEPQAGQSIEVSGSSGTNAYGVVSVWNEGEQ